MFNLSKTLQINSREALNLLIKDFEKTNIIICGEVHGIKENYLIYEYLINMLNVSQVGIELNKKLFDFIKKKDVVECEFDFKNDKRLYKYLIDGRINKSFLNLVYKLKKKNIKIFLYDNASYKDIIKSNDPRNDIRDKIMAKDILRNNINNEKTFIWAGNNHTSWKRISQGRTSMYNYLKQQGVKATLVKIEYGRGYFYNLKIKKIKGDKNITEYRLLKYKYGYKFQIPNPKAIIPYYK
ncbi:hypothetical protein M1145_00280 [Patescibacteria group bacterium]|nr:hypothetical protein [Patescibacteria group bacterium]